MIGYLEIFCQILQAAFHTTSPRFSFIYVLYCPPVLHSSSIPSPTHPHTVAMSPATRPCHFLRPQTPAWAYNAPAAPRENMPSDALQNINTLDVTKTVFNRRWKLMLSHPPSWIGKQWRSQSNTKMDYFSQLLVWKRFLSWKLIFSIEGPCTSRGVQCETATFEPHNGGMNLDTEWPLAKQTGGDIKRLGQEEKWKKGCSCTQPPYRNNTKHTRCVISLKSVFM